jgi:hypothetical protein
MTQLSFMEMSFPNDTIAGLADTARPPPSVLIATAMLQLAFLPL